MAAMGRLAWCSPVTQDEQTRLFPWFCSRVLGIFGWQVCAYGVVYCITTGMIPSSNWVVKLMLKNIHNIWNIWIYLTIFVLFSKKFHFDWMKQFTSIKALLWWFVKFHWEFDELLARQSIVCPFAGNSGGCLLGNETCHKQIDRCIAPVTIVP